MIVAIPKEIKNREYRVGITQAGVRTLAEDGQTVLVQEGAGEGSGLSDTEFRQAGAQIVADGGELYARGELIVKVKEPLPIEYEHLRPGQILFTYLHLAAVPELARLLLERQVTGIAYETIEEPDGGHPLLQPMSEIAGRMAVQVGASYLQKERGGKGVLLAGAPGVKAGRVVILGAGGAGSNAVRIAVGMGAEVTVIDIDPKRLVAMDEQYGNRIRTLISNSQNIEDEVLKADLLIGAVLVTGARAPRLVGAELVRRMASGSVIVDIAVDQGGCIETTHPTTHDDPVYSVNGVLHYAVPNMPGAVSRTSTFALTNRTLPYVRRLAALGLAAAVEDPTLRKGINTHAGRMCHQTVAQAVELPWAPFAL
jgi:alanine dehydrogenase